MRRLKLGATSVFDSTATYLASAAGTYSEKRYSRPVTTGGGQMGALPPWKFVLPIEKFLIPLFIQITAPMLLLLEIILVTGLRHRGCENEPRLLY